MNHERVAAELEIRNLIATLAHLADGSAHLDVYLDNFTDDAVWEYVDITKSVKGFLEHQLRGKDEIRENREMYRSMGVHGPGSLSYHMNSTLAVRFLDDQIAEATSHLQWVDARKHPPVLAIVGIYRDTLVVDGDKWRLKHRRAEGTRLP